jgi:hypothetical protein
VPYVFFTASRQPLADAIDAQLILGGFPQITQEWRPGTGMWDFLEEQISNPTSPLIVGGERILSAEFPEEPGPGRYSRPSSTFRMLPDERFGDAQYVGGYWTRKGDVEVDLVGAEKKVRPRHVAFVGSIKWREWTPFGGRDLGRIAAQRNEVPGTDEDAVLVGVSREGFDERGRGVDVALAPEDLLEAWK